MKETKKKKGFKIFRRIKKWRLGDYFRQLSAIIIGVVVTFIGSDLINAHYKQKEVASVMHLIQTEMLRNQEQIIWLGKKIIREESIIKKLAAYDFDHTRIPLDTLAAYQNDINGIIPLYYSTTSLEVLKSSALIPHIADKEFLLKLIMTYEHTQRLSELVDAFYAKGDSAWKSVIAGVNLKADWDAPNVFYSIILQDKSMRNYLASVAGFFDASDFSNVSDEIEECVRYIEKNYKF